MHGCALVTNGVQQPALNSFAKRVARSERRALYAPDPTHLAEKALRDAQKAVELKPEWFKAYSRLGMASFLLEKFQDARTAYQTGLKFKPEDEDMKVSGLNCFQAYFCALLLSFLFVGFDALAMNGYISVRLWSECDFQARWHDCLFVRR